MRITKAEAIRRLVAHEFHKEAGYLRRYQSSVPKAGNSGWDGHIKSKKNGFSAAALAAIW